MKIGEREGHVGVTMTFGPPAIYFDHWAIRLFSETGAIQDRLVDLVHRKVGTFVLSVWNLAEFSGPTDLQNAVDAERLLDRLMPNVYVTDFDLERAMRMEQEAQEKDLRVFMPPCRWILRGMLERALANQEPISLRGLVTEATHERARLGPFMDELVGEIRDKMLELRAMPDYVKKARDARIDAQRPRLWVVLSELQRELILDPECVIKTSDVSDMMHAALPAMGCDFLLLDGAWVSRVEKMSRRAREHGFDLPLSRCFSKRDGGVERFLDALEEFSGRSAVARPA